MQPAGALQMPGFGPVYGHPQAQPPAEEDSPLFRTDDFRIWCMKVIPCTKRFVHDWTVCPFAHAGEKAVRRDPRTCEYTGIACPDMKKSGACLRGERCPYAHNVFEYWLHPTRYRTQLCNDGPACRRAICFFAHSLDELRVPACKPYVSPEALARASLEAIHANPHPLGAQLAPAGCHQPGCHQPSGRATPPELQARSAQAQAAAAAGLGADPAHCAPHHARRRSRGSRPGSFDLGGQSPAGVGGADAWSDAASVASGSSWPAAGGGAPGTGVWLPAPQAGPARQGWGAEVEAPCRPGLDLRSSAGRAGAARRGSPPPLPDSLGPALALLEQSGDAGLAAALAGLKIQLTQRQAAASGGSNHDIVISTLHQILRNAQAAQAAAGGGGGGGGGHGSSPPQAPRGPARAAPPGQQRWSGVPGVHSAPPPSLASLWPSAASVERHSEAGGLSATATPFSGAAGPLPGPGRRRGAAADCGAAHPARPGSPTSQLRGSASSQPTSAEVSARCSLEDEAAAAAERAGQC